MTHDLVGAGSAVPKALPLARGCREDNGLYGRQEGVPVFPAEATATYHEFLAAYPNDIQGTASLAELYLRANKVDSAAALYNRILDHADSATAEDLFAAARSLLSVIASSPDTAVMDADCAKAAKKRSPALTARQVAARCGPAAADTMRKYHALTDPQYALVAKTYQAGLAKNPYSRDP